MPSTVVGWVGNETPRGYVLQLANCTFMLTHVTKAHLPSPQWPLRHGFPTDNINQSLGIWLKAGVLIGKATLKAAAAKSFWTGVLTTGLWPTGDWQKAKSKRQKLASKLQNITCIYVPRLSHYILTIINGTSFIISAQNQLHTTSNSNSYSKFNYFAFPVAVASITGSHTGNPCHLFTNFRCDVQLTLMFAFLDFSNYFSIFYSTFRPFIV